MGWIKVKVQEGNEVKTITVFRATSRKEAIEYTFNATGGIDVQQNDSFLELVARLGMAMLRDPVLNPKNVSTIVVTAYAPDSGILPMSEVSHRLIEAYSEPVLTGFTDTKTYAMISYMPGSFYWFMNEGIQDTVLSNGPFTPTAVSEGTPKPTIPDFIRAITRIPATVAYISPPIAYGGPDVAVYQYTDNRLRDVVTSMQVAYAILMASASYSSGQYGAEYLPLIDKALELLWLAMDRTGLLVDSIYASVNPIRNLYALVLIGNDIAKKENLSPTLTDDEVKQLYLLIENGWGDFQKKALDAGMLPLVFVMGGPGVLHQIFPVTQDEAEKFETLRNATDKLMQAYAYLQSKQLQSYSNAIINLELALKILSLPGWREYVGTLQDPVTTAKNSGDDREKTTGATIAEAIKDYLEANGITDDKILSVAERINSMSVEEVADVLKGNGFFTDVIHNSVALILGMPTQDFWPSGVILPTKLGLIIFEKQIPKSTAEKVMEKIRMKRWLANILNDYVKAVNALAKLFNATAMMEIDQTDVIPVPPEYKGYVMVNGPKITGPTIGYRETDDFVYIAMFLPFKNPCPVTNVYYYKWTDSGYVTVPLDPVDTSMRWVPSTSCGQVTYDYQRLLNIYGATAEDIGAGPILIVAVLIAVAGIYFAASLSSQEALRQVGHITNSDFYAFQLATRATVQNVEEAEKAVQHEASVVYYSGHIVDDVCKKDPNSSVCQQFADIYKNMASNYGKDSSKFLDIVQQGNQNINNEYKQLQDLYNKALDEISQLNQLFTLDGIKKYLLYMGLFVAGVAVVPPLAVSLGRSLITGLTSGGTRGTEYVVEKTVPVAGRIERGTAPVVEKTRR